MNAIYLSPLRSSEKNAIAPLSLLYSIMPFPCTPKYAEPSWLQLIKCIFPPLTKVNISCGTSTRRYVLTSKHTMSPLVLPIQSMPSLSSVINETLMLAWNVSSLNMFRCLSATRTRSVDCSWGHIHICSEALSTTKSKRLCISGFCVLSMTLKSVFDIRDRPKRSFTTMEAESISCMPYTILKPVLFPE